MFKKVFTIGCLLSFSLGLSAQNAQSLGTTSPKFNPSSDVALTQATKTVENTTLATSPLPPHEPNLEETDLDGPPLLDEYRLDLEANFPGNLAKAKNIQLTEEFLNELNSFLEGMNYRRTYGSQALGSYKLESISFEQRKLTTYIITAYSRTDRSVFRILQPIDLVTFEKIYTMAQKGFIDSMPSWNASHLRLGLEGIKGKEIFEYLKNGYAGFLFF